MFLPKLEPTINDPSAMRVYTLKRIGYGWALLASQLFAIPLTAAFFSVGVIREAPAFTTEYHLLKTPLFIFSIYFFIAAFTAIPLIWLIGIANWFLGKTLNSGKFAASLTYDAEDQRAPQPNIYFGLFVVFVLPLVLLLLLAIAVTLASRLMEMST